MTSKNKYKEYCTSRPVALYQNDWWLDAVCGESWDAVFDGDSAFAFPYKKKYGLKLIGMPMLTLGLGPVGGKELSDILLDKLPPFDLLDLYLLPGIDSKITSYKVAGRNTHHLSSISNTEEVFKEFSSSTRQQIRKAEKKVKVTESDSVELLYKMVSHTFKRQGKKAPYTLAYVKSIYEACRKHKCCRILVAKDEAGDVHGACLLAWDKRTAYYVMGGSDPKHKSSAAYSLLMWEAIKEASKHSKEFDFCGSTIASIARFFKGFGGEPLPYLHLKKVNSKALKLVMALKGK